ncbi:hypothetical protein LXL04_022102 [Taraxacum kok-saghyz]
MSWTHTTMVLQVALIVDQLLTISLPDPMHVYRGGWLGQTYALAKFDDSFEGKKTGTRRSKEERKGMVETFIKRYQKSNNGDFPSLNLTRKEVGGSFYTVREIVREIIQENRVLGPPKSPPGDRNMENLDSFLEHNLLGSISVHPNETQTVEENIGEEKEKEKEKEKVNGLVTNQSQKHQVLGDSALRIVTDTIHNMEEMASEIREVASDVLDIQLNEEITLESQSSQSHSSGEENSVLDVNVNTNELEDSLPAKEKQTINGANTQNLHNNSVQHSKFDETTPNSYKSSDISQKRRTTATLNRFNLSESWEAASKKSNGQETHRFVTFVKAFISAFVKFWSE